MFFVPAKLAANVMAKLTTRLLPDPETVDWAALRLHWLLLRTVAEPGAADEPAVAALLYRPKTLSVTAVYCFPPMAGLTATA